MKKWHLDCSEKDGVLYCDIYHEGKDIGFISATKDDTITFELAADIHEHVGTKIESWRDKEGNFIPMADMHTYYLKPTEEHIKRLEKEDIPWYDYALRHSYHSLKDLARKYHIKPSTKREMIEKLREKGVPL